MKKITLFALSVFVLVASSLPSRAQQPKEVEIKNVQPTLVLTPQYTTNPPPKQVRATNWVVIETTFDSKADLINELTFNYYVSFVGHPQSVYVGRVTHVNIEKGQGLHSSAYISPSALSRILKKKTLTLGDIENVTVTVTKPGISAAIDAKGAKPFNGPWWETRQMQDGFVLNKSETPFAPLAWEYYEALKPASFSR